MIYQKKNLWKSAIFHPIKLPFDGEAAEKFLKVIYFILVLQLYNYETFGQNPSKRSSELLFEFGFFHFLHLKNTYFSTNSNNESTTRNISEFWPIFFSSQKNVDLVGEVSRAPQGHGKVWKIWGGGRIKKTKPTFFLPPAACSPPVPKAPTALDRNRRNSFVRMITL